jgi:hypothetical protein
MVVPVPRQIEQRGRMAGMKSRIAPETASREIAPARSIVNQPAHDEPARDEKSKSDDTLDEDDTPDQPAQPLVRVLIVIEHEREARPPAAAAPPPAK